MGGWPKGGNPLPTFTEVLVILPFFEKTWEKMQWKWFLGVFGVQISIIFFIFVKIFRKWRDFKNSCRIWSNLMYSVVLKLNIGRGAEEAAKILKEWPFWANLTPSNSTILWFWGPSNSTIFKNFRPPTLVELSEVHLNQRGKFWIRSRQFYQRGWLGEVTIKRGRWLTTSFETGLCNATILVKFWGKFVGKYAFKMDFLEFWACASERKGFENSKNGFKFLLCQKLRKIEHFKILKFSKNFRKICDFQDFFENVGN